MISCTLRRVCCVVLLIAAGGCKRPPVQPGAGTDTGQPGRFVTVEQVDGAWWFVHGDEHFVMRSVNVVQPVDDAPADNGLRYDALAGCSNDVRQWTAVTAARLRNWGFNTVGGWSHEYLCFNSDLYFTVVLSLGYWGENDSRLIDVFSGEYEQAINQKAAVGTAPYVNEERLVGYFANNELPWYGERGWPTGPEVSLLSRYMKLDPDAAGKKRLIQFFRERYNGSLSALRKEWIVHGGSFDDLLRQRVIKPVSRRSAKTVNAWAGVVAEQYFSLCEQALRRYDPNHLFLGVRFAKRAQVPVLKACGRYCDVISLNQYRKDGSFNKEEVCAISRLSGKPVMITEFAWRAEENSSGCPNTMGADVTVPTQADRAAAYSNYVTEAVSLPFVVGYDWFMYHDQPPGGRFDGEDSNYGLVDVHDQPYEELLRTVSSVNRRVGALHQAAEYYSGACPDLVDYRKVSVRGGDKKLSAPQTLVDHASSYAKWGDRDYRMKITPLGGNMLRFDVNPGNGWGCGVTFNRLHGERKQRDGSVDITGASGLELSLVVTNDFMMGVNIGESGVGPHHRQTFAGLGHADGESWEIKARPVKANGNTIVLDLLDADLNGGYGNQVGNQVIDADAVQSIDLSFPGKQKPFSFCLKMITAK